jgi:hypothetical protein
MFVFRSLLVLGAGLLCHCGNGAPSATDSAVAASSAAGPAESAPGASNGGGVGGSGSSGNPGVDGEVAAVNNLVAGAAASSSDMPGSDGATMGGAASSTGAADAGGDAGSSGSTSGAAAPFACTLFVGPSTMGQWFNGGFLNYPGIDPARWELIMVAHHYTNAWAVPGDPAWKTAVSHPCANGAGSPDRVAFMATQWTENTAAQWEADFAGIIENILAEWPAVKRIELMPSTCAPGNQLCPVAGASSETVIPAYGYAAIDAMPAKYPGLVIATPHFEVPKCSDFIGNGTAPQYAPDATATTGPAVLDVANVFGAYYAAHL